MLSVAAEKVVALLERVLTDALAHESGGVLVTAVSAGFRFETETGASLGFLPRIQVTWHDLQSVFECLNADAEQNGFAECVTIDAASERITVSLAGNERYFQGNVAAIMKRLRG